MAEEDSVAWPGGSRWPGMVILRAWSGIGSSRLAGVSGDIAWWSGRMGRHPLVGRAVLNSGRSHRCSPVNSSFSQAMASL